MNTIQETSSPVMEWTHPEDFVASETVGGDGSVEVLPVRVEDGQNSVAERKLHERRVPAHSPRGGGGLHHRTVVGYQH